LAALPRYALLYLQKRGIPVVIRTFRALGAALAAAAILSLAPAPALAGDAEVKYLHSLVGDWSGTGTIKGEEGGDVACRIVFKPSGAKVNFSGRCKMGGRSGTQSFSGSIRYNDSKGVFESSSQGVTVQGAKKGSTVTFVVNRRMMGGQLSSTMSFSPKSLKVQFSMKNRSGVTGGTIPFSRV
jgi:hypothetical protein